MNSKFSRIYVKFIDGVEFYIPVEASFVSENIYQVMPDDEFDYDDNAVLFEFGSQDIVRVKQLENEIRLPAAYELVKAGDARNLQKRLLTRILLHAPEPQEFFVGVSQSEIKSLCQKLGEANFVYPDIKNWFTLHKEKIQSLINEEIKLGF